MRFEVKLQADSVEELVSLMEGLITKHKPKQTAVEIGETWAERMGKFARTLDDVALGVTPTIGDKLNKLFEMLFGAKPEQVVVGRAMPMNYEINAITVIEMFAQECPEWAEVAKKYRALLAQPTTLYRIQE